MRSILFVSIFLSSLQLFAGSLPDRDPALAKKLVTEENGLLLDVRSDKEFKQGSILGAKHIPVQSLSDRLSDIEKMTKGNKNKPIVVFCAVGGRAAKAKIILEKAGYTRVTNMGGVSDWPQK